MHRWTMRSGLLLVAVVLVLGACSSGKKSAPTTTTPATSGVVPGSGPDITSFTVPASVDCATGQIDVTWTTRDVSEVALFVDNIQRASGPDEQGNDMLHVPCDGKAHRIGIEAIGTNGQTVSDAKVTKTTATPSPSTTPTTTPNPTGCVSFATLNTMMSAYVARTGSPGLSARSAQCVGNYNAVTFAIDNAGGTAKALFVVNGTQVRLVGAPTPGNAPPRYAYENCQLDPQALSQLALPALVSTGGKGVQNCGPIAWNL
jgi:hypothetical protein